VLWESGSKTLTVFCGPASLGADRKCFQIDGPDRITVNTGRPMHQDVCLTAEEAKRVALAILFNLGWKLPPFDLNATGAPSIVPSCCCPLDAGRCPMHGAEVHRG